MYCTPCARLMKSITPRRSASRAAIRYSSAPSCRPWSVWTRRRVRDIRASYPSPAGGGWLRVSGASEETGGEISTISAPPGRGGAAPPPPPPRGGGGGGGGGGGRGGEKGWENFNDLGPTRPPLRGVHPPRC